MKIVTIILYALVCYLAWYSNGIITMLMALMWVIGITALATLFSTIFFDGSFTEKIIYASKITFPVAALILILGYFYECLKPML